MLESGPSTRNFPGGMGICLGRHARGLGTYDVASPLAFCQEELLVWCQAVYRWLRAFAFARFFVGSIGEVDAAKISERLAEYELPIQVDSGLDEVARHTASRCMRSSL